MSKVPRKAMLTRAREGGSPNEAFVLIQVTTLLDVALALAGAADIDMDIKVVGRLPDGTEVMNMESTSNVDPDRWKK